jgi:hypothetical protein
VSPLPRSKKEAQDTVDPQQVLILGVSEHPHHRHCSHGLLEPVAEEGRGENEVVQPVNPTTNAAANAPANPAVNAPANALANATGNVANNTANVANV